MHEIGALKKAVDLCNQIALDHQIASIMKITYYETNENDTYEAYIATNNNKFNILSVQYTGNGTCRYKTIEELNKINN